MKNLKIKQKVLILTALPLIFAVAVLTLLSINKVRSIGEDDVVQLRQTMTEAKREALKKYVEITLSSIKPIIEQQKDVEVAKAEVKRILGKISFEQGNGYIFAYEFDGTNVVLPIKPELQGKNLMHLRDKNGVEFLRDLISVARNGGGYVQYLWDKPSKGYEVSKLSYSTVINEFGWMLGTGFYIDDIDDAVALSRAEVEQRVQSTIMLSGIVGLVILVIVVLLNLWISNRTLVQPIRKLSESAHQMSMGKLNIDIDVDSKDEIGELADAIRRLQSSLKIIFKKFKQTKK